MNRLEPFSISVRVLKCAFALALIAAVAACSGGAPTQENPPTSAPPAQGYTGPAPANADVQAFRINLWENIKAGNRCGGCHGAGGQAPQFARNDDVNLAYQAANTVVNLERPEESRMVIKVAEGHNCWLQSASACGDTLTVWIRNWAGEMATGGRQIQLQPPTIKEVGASKTFPEDSSSFASTVWQTLRQLRCDRCHSSNAVTPQSPFFASSDPDEAYAAARSKINLDDPAKSRFVVRLRDEFHNCWSNCAQDADAMLQAIEAFAGGIQPVNPLEADPTLVLSKALTMYDGTVAAGGNRYDNNVIALYEFKTGTGNIAYDTSGVEPALNLTISGNVTWVGGWGLSFGAGGKAQGSTTASRKLADMIRSTGEFSVEVWAAPANVVQEDAYIVSYSAGAMARNFTLAQREYQYEAMTRSSETDANGMPVLITNANDRDAQASLQHVVLTYDPVNGRRLYVNGNFTGDVDPQPGGTLADWDDTFALVLGNETSNNRQWQGVLRLVAIHNRALTPEQVQQNFAAGVGERYFLLFNVSHLVDVPQSYVMFEVSQLDSYAYLFNKPTFISLDPDARPDGIPIRGVRIGVNGSEAAVGQAYATLDVTVSASSYTPESGQLLSDIGTVIGLEKGPAADEFFLSFEQIGNHTHVVVEAPPPAPAPPVDGEEQPDVGLRTFDEINATMAAITGVPPTRAAIATTYERLRQQLPTVEPVGTFLASHQTGIAQLAIRYCAELVDDEDLRKEFFPDVDFDETASAFFATTAGRNAVIDPLIEKAVGTGLIAQPSDTDIRTELNWLIDRLIADGAGDEDGRTEVVVKASCAAVLGSGTMLLH